MTASDAARATRATRCSKSIPLGRIGKPEDVAEAVAFLAGPAAGVHHRTSLARQRRTFDVRYAPP